jgi:predicted DsbA family dithiol-disulfide isomerase
MDIDQPLFTVEALYFTDPLCSWSWALEPELRRLETEFGGAVQWRTVLGGMISDWLTYSDPLNAVSRPAQMGPQWLHVKRLTGVEIDERIWVEDPPASSYPACLAVKAAELQGAEAGARYLVRAREAVMRERRNIARPEVLLELAEELAAVRSLGFEAERFRSDFASEAAQEAFRDDLKETRYREIGRFPTLVFRAPRGSGVLLAGYRPYAALRAALLHVAPGLEAVEGCPDEESDTPYHLSATTFRGEVS